MKVETEMLSNRFSHGGRPSESVGSAAYHFTPSGELAQRETAATVTLPIVNIYNIARRVDPNITHEGIFASSPEGPYGRPFGRDSAIVALFALAMHRMEPNVDRTSRTVSAIRSMGSHIALRDVTEAGIQRGKMAHEIGRLEEGFPADWYRDESGVGRNHDSLDATSRHVSVIKEILDLDPDQAPELLPLVELMAEWEIRNTIEFGGAAFVPAELDENRTYPGLYQQRWRDCRYSTVGEDGDILKPPVYPLEEQSLRWASLSAAADMLADHNPELAQEAKVTAAYMKQMFMDRFVYEDENGVGLADALDGEGNQSRAVTIDQLLALLPSHNGESIIDDPKMREEIIDRAFRELFTPAGLRTISPQSKVHPDSIYHGPKSIWPHAQGLAVMALHQEAMRNKGVDNVLYEKDRARVLQLAQAMFGPLVHFNSPIESIQIKDDGSIELYSETDGEGNTRTCPVEQTWAGMAGGYVGTLLEKEYGMKEVTIPVFVRTAPLPASADVYARTA